MAETLPKLEDTGEVSVGNYRFQRLALGIMRLLSSDAQVDGERVECFANPTDPEANCALLHAAIKECGIAYIDFARGYGARPGAGEEWFREWMQPYLRDVLWATKVGYERDNKGAWLLNLCPDFLAREIELSLDSLGRPIPLCYLTASSTQDVTVLNSQHSILESFKPLLKSYERGELLHLGLANVTAEQLRRVLEVAPISVVQNKFTVASLAQPEQVELIELCASHDIPFVAWGIFQSDDHGPWKPENNLLEAAKELSLTPQEASIAILLKAYSNLVVLTGASRRESLSSSVRAANLAIPDEMHMRFRPLLK